MDFVLKYFSGRLGLPQLTFDDIRADSLTLLQKAVSQNKVEIVKKFVTVFNANLDATTPEFPLPEWTIICFFLLLCLIAKIPRTRVKLRFLSILQPIFIAASKRKVRSTEFLVKAGADVMSKITCNMEQLGYVTYFMFEILPLCVENDFNRNIPHHLPLFSLKT